jgi:hypothetical protein
MRKSIDQTHHEMMEFKKEYNRLKEISEDQLEELKEETREAKKQKRGTVEPPYSHHVKAFYEHKNKDMLE